MIYVQKDTMRPMTNNTFQDFKCDFEQDIFEFYSFTKEKISKLIVENGLKCDFDWIRQFIKESIEGREYAKFVFTKHLSKILLYIEEFGLKLGFKRRFSLC